MESLNNTKENYHKDIVIRYLDKYGTIVYVRNVTYFEIDENGDCHFKFLNNNITPEDGSIGRVMKATLEHCDYLDLSIIAERKNNSFIYGRE